MSGMDIGVVDLNRTGVPPSNGAFLRFYPTSASASTVAPSLGSVFMYVWIFLGLFVFLLILLVTALRKLKNIITSSSSLPDYGNEAGSYFNHMEIGSISSQRSTTSSLSHFEV